MFRLSLKMDDKKIANCSKVEGWSVVCRRLPFGTSRTMFVWQVFSNPYKCKTRQVSGNRQNIRMGWQMLLPYKWQLRCHLETDIEMNAVNRRNRPRHRSGFFLHSGKKKNEKNFANRVHNNKRNTVTKAGRLV